MVVGALDREDAFRHTIRGRQCFLSRRLHVTSGSEQTPLLKGWDPTCTDHLVKGFRGPHAVSAES